MRTQCQLTWAASQSIASVHHSAPLRAASNSQPAVWKRKMSRAMRSRLVRGDVSAAETQKVCPSE